METTKRRIGGRMKWLAFAVVGMMACGWAFAFANAAHADIIVYEPFDMADTVGDGTRIKNIAEGDILNSIGLTGMYLGHNNLYYKQDGLTFSNLEFLGGRLYHDHQLGKNQGVGRLLAQDTTGTVYGSYLWRREAGASGSKNVTAVAISDDYDAADADRLWQFNALAHRWNSAGQHYGMVGTGGDGGEPPHASAIAEGEQIPPDDPDTYLVLAEFTNILAAGSDPGDQEAALWILTEDQFDYFKPGGLTADELNAAVLGPDPNQVHQRAYISTTTGEAIMTTLQYLEIEATTSSGGPNQMSVDEIRFGRSLDDVTPLVPEPGTMTLLAAGGVAFLLQRRRQRRKG
jgi:hypothetical protein